MKSSIYDWMKDGFTMVPNVLFNRFHQLNLSSDEMLLILYLFSQMNQNHSIEETTKIANQLGWTSNKLFSELNHLMDKNFLSIELVPDKYGKQTDHYSLRPLFEQLDERYYQKNTAKDKQVQTHQEIAKEDDLFKETESLVMTFENEFGRMLTPLELETLNNWISKDNYQPALIKYALKEAVIHQALSLKYIDRILLTWEKKNIRTVNEAKRESERFQQGQQKNIPPKSNNNRYDHFEIPLYDWKSNN